MGQRIKIKMGEFLLPAFGGPFSFYGLACRALIEEFVHGVIVIFAMFGCCLEACPFLRGNRGAVHLREVGTGSKEGKGKLRKGI